MPSQSPAQRHTATLCALSVTVLPVSSCQSPSASGNTWYGWGMLCSCPLGLTGECLPVLGMGQVLFSPAPCNSAGGGQNFHFTG